ncbi:hypothetical protein P9314_22340 [Paenibacillus validus]|uniref:Uncharacterized protein n=2 Tax=Paenibacillus validus TaxID=44253 RepID=A0A7X3CSB1_9BACL|nr:MULTISPECIES: hypothetical protein [Paenibacillus]MED4603369.1 hypothetical protein [Paenibacillus validus]MED4607960.1 hypothetical protein [Paenibacillus validus]MUG71137.1 hypothetical protein [Paenibacillus validus]
MEARKVYVRDNFLSRGETDITDERERKIGTLDLHGMFQSGVTVQSFSDGLTSYSGKFRAFSNTWLVFNGGDQEIGTLKAKFTFFTKRYVYDSDTHGTFYIESPAFSREYTVKTEREQLAAEFRRVDGMFGAGAFELTNDSTLPMEELIVVVMGVHAIQKRQSAAST